MSRPCAFFGLFILGVSFFALNASMAIRYAHAQGELPPPLHERIDREIETRAGGPVAEPANDAEFFRRVSLDLAGMIPTADEAQAFAADPSPGKRSQVIDRLLASPEFGRRMQEAFSAMLLERRAGSPVADAEWNRFLRDSFHANKPWDQLVRELLFADDSDALKPARKFLSVAGRDKNPHQLTQDVARLLLGRSIMCAQCHDHPTVDDYSQAEYFGLYSYLQDKPEQAKSEFESVFVAGKKETFPRLPGKEPVTIPVFMKDQAEQAKAFRPRLLLARDLPTADNPLFVRNSVNRFWFLMLGRGLVHPLDLDHAGNPPSHPELLALLAQDFAAHRFDVKYLLKEIALSRVYQRSSRLPTGVPVDSAGPTTYRVFNPKPLSPEQLAWSMLRATGNQPRFEQARTPEKMEFGWYNYINGRIATPPANVPEVLDLFVGVFGNPPGEPEMEFNPSMGQALFVLNERLVLQWLEPRDGNLAAQLRSITDRDERIRAAHWAVLGRAPTASDLAIAAEFVTPAVTPATTATTAAATDQLWTDYVWALLASDEFRMNH
ncbi:MAG: hypothetical protein RLY70_4735 [Planctomycetota bacterium]